MGAASFIAIFALKLPFPAIIAGAALIGYCGGRIVPDKLAAGGGHGKAAASFGKALIDDDTPPPQHAVFRWPRLVRVALIGGVLWLLPMTLLIASFDWQHTLSQMARFFTKAALLTFGGAWSVCRRHTERKFSMD